eukprot:729261-Rhodomonas_salina.2
MKWGWKLTTALTRLWLSWRLPQINTVNVSIWLEKCLRFTKCNCTGTEQDGEEGASEGESTGKSGRLTSTFVFEMMPLPTMRRTTVATAFPPTAASFLSLPTSNRISPVTTTGDSSAATVIGAVGIATRARAAAMKLRRSELTSDSFADMRRFRGEEHVEVTALVPRACETTPDGVMKAFEAQSAAKRQKQRRREVLAMVCGLLGLQF